MQRLWGEKKHGMFKEKKAGQGVWNVVGEGREGRTWNWRNGQGLDRTIEYVSQMRLLWMLTNNPHISIASHKEGYLSLILHVYCGLATNLLHSRTQIDGTAPTWDTSGLFAEGREKVEGGSCDGLTASAWKWMCHFHWPKQVTWPKVMPSGVGMHSPPTERSSGSCDQQCSLPRRLWWGDSILF